MGKSQNTLFLATGIDGKRGMEVKNLPFRPIPWKNPAASCGVLHLF